MKDLTPKDSRYVPLVQQRWCCVPACISMVMYKHGMKLLPQEYLAYHLGLIVPKEDRALFSTARTGKKPKAGYGTQIEKKEYSPNVVFPKLKIPLKMTYHSARDLDMPRLSELLVTAEKGNKDLLVCFDTGALGKTKNHGGHVCVFDRIDAKKGMVRLIDPASSQPKWRTVSLEDLYRGMRYHWNKSGGVWEFTSTKKAY